MLLENIRKEKVSFFAFEVLANKRRVKKEGGKMKNY